MKIYTGTAWGKNYQKECEELSIGMMPSPLDPVHPDRIPVEISVACDNGAFRCFRDKTGFDSKLFYKWLNSINREIDWVVAPDKVCGRMESYYFSLQHINQIPFKKYLAVQDGMTFDLVYSGLSECDGCFIGGSTKVGQTKGWKWETAPMWVEKCKEIGLPVHMGRCPGNLRGLDAANQIGITSIDVSTLIRHQQLYRVKQFNCHLTEQQRMIV